MSFIVTKDIERLLKPETWIRMVADVAIVNLSLFVGLAVDYLIRGPLGVAGFQGHLQAFGKWWWALTLIALPTFALFGFYTRGRAYRGRYKVLVVFQAAAVANLIFAFCSYLAPASAHFPAPAILFTAVVMGFALATARLWAYFLGKVDAAKNEPNFTKAVVSATEPASVVVIGGAGYIGSALLSKLLDRGHHVRLVDTFMYGKEPIRKILDHPNLEIIEADFRQIDIIVQAMRDRDAVIHLGGIVGDPACALDEEFTIEVNLLATKMIAECAKGFGIKRFVFASTCSVYGASDEILDEHSYLNPVSLYARSKIASEKVLKQLTDESFRPTILRFGTVFGLSGRTRFDLVVNLLTAKALVDRKITVFGEDQWRPFVHVDDAALAVATALSEPLETVGAETFNVGSNSQNMTLGDVGRMIKRLVPEAELIVSGSDSDRRNYRVDFSKIENRLRYKARWTVEMGVKQVMEAFAEGLVRDYNADEYSNVKVLTERSSDFIKTDGAYLRALVEGDPNDDFLTQKSSLQ
ncbi:MAG: NAD(P)-dependent oxidoreductase [Fimbriimonadaceae bacterium]|jgi:nucleoside-diphosphate-sugar epimerase|nr:NAD(P)-dependent oxidoreductase [Fimbriimonadaceae bacterium]